MKWIVRCPTTRLYLVNAGYDYAWMMRETAKRLAHKFNARVVRLVPKKEAP